MADLGAVGRVITGRVALVGGYVSGTVRDAQGAPARRRLGLFHRGRLSYSNSAYSDASSGAYQIACHVTDDQAEHVVVCLDDGAAPVQNDLILGRVTGV